MIRVSFPQFIVAFSLVLTLQACDSSKGDEISIPVSNAEILSKKNFINLEVVYTKSIGDMTNDEYGRFESSLS